jgi:hypothetical protein
MESVSPSLALVFANLLGLGKAQWFALDVDGQRFDGLSGLLKIGSWQYQSMLLEIGWMKRRQRPHGVSLSIQATAIDAFFRRFTIPAEVVQAKVPTASKRHWFLRVGDFSTESLRPIEQFDGRRGARLSIDADILEVLKDVVKRLPPVRTDGSMAVDEEECASEELALSQSVMERAALRKRFHSQLDDIVNALSSIEIHSSVEAGEDLLDVFHRLTSRRRAKHQREVSIGCQMRVLEPIVDYDPERYQVLQKLGAPIDCLFLSHVVQEILQLEADTNTSILVHVKSRNGRHAPCMVLRRDPKARRETLELVLQHSAFTVGSMAVHLLRQDEEEVVLALQGEGLRIAVGPMPALMTQAMATRAQLGDNMMGLVRRFARLHFKVPMFASHQAVRALTGSKGLVPQCLSAMVEKRRVDYSFKGVDVVVLHELTCRPEICTNLAKVDVVVSGDHGKGFYRMIVLLLLWPRGEPGTSTKPLRVPVEIVSMRCRKDTIEVLDTVVPAVQNSLENLSGMRAYFQTSGNPILVSSDDARYAQGICIATYLAGDLAWVCEILGKHNMSGQWCPYCKINKTTRTSSSHTKAALWTIQSIQDHLHFLENVLPRRATAQEKQGVVRPPLIRTIPLRNLVPPVLHMEIGLVNNIVECLETWCHALFDPSPSIELEVARLSRLESMRAKDEANDALDAFYADAFSGGNLLALLSRQEDLGEVLGVQELDELDRLQAEEAACQAVVKAAHKSVASAKAAENKLGKSFGRLSRPIILRIEEEVYLAWSIRRPSYHGGDFIGTSCRLLMGLAEAVIGSIATLLLSVPLADRPTAVTDEDVQQFTDAIMRLLQYADCIFSIARKGEREVVQADRENGKQYVARFCRLWRLVGLPSTIKFHILEDHLLDYLGNGERLEDATEQQHQISYSFEQRARISDYKKKARVASRHETIRNDQAIKNETQRVLTETSRPKRRDANKERMEKEVKRRRQGRLDLLTMSEVTVFPQVDSVLLDQLQAYQATREENEE